ncbi:hypothetical protein Q5H93_14650 [Hymenobacter sp. ASUV-10]|uniref:Uncharacterized protein n=1 Tax=Hymenobacter aranciens TaxID=3063996 RepID=A0ABT9BH49_9BACT|nr:hypothetical protein [Hymenobacter sp. ASUV-10]MDO7875981.1 hypothetical protein [Hymenobacter sp. ASUV-10]
MEKVFTLLWVLFAVVAFVVRMVKKMRDNAARETQERPARPSVPELPAASFQEMLKQMQARNVAPASSEASRSEQQSRPAVSNTRRTPGGRPMPQAKAQPARSQERTDIRPKSQERPALTPVFAAALPRASREVPIEDYWQQRARQQAELPPPSVPTVVAVRQLLARPESVRAAFVLSEILQRRHF